MTTAEGRQGQTVPGTRNVTKDGDTINVDRSVQSSTGASVSKEKEVKVDDGRVESVERNVSATDRYGRTAQHEGKAEREGYGWEFEGEGKNRNGQNVEVDGYGARGYYGSGAIADVEGGRYGNRTVVAGKPYGGPTYVKQLPYGARPHTYWGRPYYAHGGIYYPPYTVHGAVVAMETGEVRLTAKGKGPGKKIAGGAVGAAIGGIVGGGEGAAIGAVAGAGGGTAMAAASDGNQVVAASGSTLEFALVKPLTVTILQAATPTQ